MLHDSLYPSQRKLRFMNLFSKTSSDLIVGLLTQQNSSPFINHPNLLHSML
jgi:hypothetical protein